jgi:hypothetical protein
MRSAPLSTLGFEAKKRFGLCVLDYVVTSNHVQLLVKYAGQRYRPEHAAHRRPDRHRKFGVNEIGNVKDPLTSRQRGY